MIKVVNFSYKLPEGDYNVVNTTSRSNNWSSGLSPFFCGPCELYDGYVGKNVENSWQHSKCFEYYLDDGEVGERYFKWAQEGWNNPRAIRHPMGRDAKPLYSYWDGEKLNYISARLKIYIPLYSKAVAKTDAFKKLKSIYDEGKDLYLLDFDTVGVPEDFTDFKKLFENPSIKVGHGYVLAMMLLGQINVSI